MGEHFYDKPEDVIAIWFRPFSMFFGFFWSLLFLEVFRSFLTDTIAPVFAIASFIAVSLIFVWLGTYQHWLLRLGKEQDAVLMNVIRCVGLTLSVSVFFGGYTGLVVAQVKPLAGQAVKAAVVSGAVLAFWCIIGLVAMLYYFAGVQLALRRRRTLDFPDTDP